jgi:sialate O-acetylesterase
MKATLLVLVALAGAQANVNLPAVISDRMVLQQGVPVRIWGHADPGEAVTVSLVAQADSLRAQKSSTTADSAAPVNPTWASRWRA